jgi:hypothetical protein
MAGLAGTVAAHPDQHGPNEGHLLGNGAWGNIELISVAEVESTSGGSTDELVADVAVSPDGNFAYLANWGEEDCAGPEKGGRTSPDAGAWVVDIRDLENPEVVGFIPSHQDTRHGEGAQVANITTSFFSGDVLVLNNEQCGKNGKGGVLLWDVTDPFKPMRLSQHWGDRTVGLSDTHAIHSSFAWDAGDNAYVVIVDNVEFPDVDILDITNPHRPRLIAEYDLNEFDVAQPEIGLTSSFIHDMVVKEIDGRFIMLVSYWDGGWVLLDVTNPADAQFLGDTDYAPVDQLLLERTGAQLTPEGNGHQAEFTADNRFFIGTDEDFAPYRVVVSSAAGTFNATPGTNVPSVEPGSPLTGDAVFVGLACTASGPIPTAAETGATIAVVERGGCTFTEKAGNVEAAGYSAGVVFNHVDGCDARVTMSVEGGIPFVFVGRTDRLTLLGVTDPTCETPAPAVGTIAEDVTLEAALDGWGYVRLFDANTLVELDQYAIPEAHDPAFAFGFGDLTVHEVATDPVDWDRAYLSYYAGGLRSIEIQRADPADTSTCELVEIGGYLDPNGNNFWGVEAFVRDGETIILGSDRDSGLWIFRRTD